MFIDIQAFLRSTRGGRRAGGSGRRRREDHVPRSAWPQLPSPYSSGFLNELGSWCGVEQTPSRRGSGYVWIPWDTTGQIRRFR